jgi:hypothetical protein
MEKCIWQVKEIIEEIFDKLQMHIMTTILDLVT